MSESKETVLSVDQNTGMWIADNGMVIGYGKSPEEAVKNLAKIADIELAEPLDEDWITPDIL